jgi:hypothetical protein
VIAFQPYVIVFAQYLVGVLILLPWLLRNGPRALTTQRPWLHFWRSIAGWVGFMAYYIALAHVPLVDAALLRSAAPLWVPGILFLWLGVRLPWARWAAIGIGFAGVLLILHPDSGGISVWHSIGMFAGIGLAASMATTRQLATTESPQAIIFYYFGIAGVATSPVRVVDMGNTLCHRRTGVVVHRRIHLHHHGALHRSLYLREIQRDLTAEFSWRGVRGSLRRAVLGRSPGLADADRHRAGDGRRRARGMAGITQHHRRSVTTAFRRGGKYCARFQR